MVANFEEIKQIPSHFPNPRKERCILTRMNQNRSFKEVQVICKTDHKKVATPCFIFAVTLVIETGNNFRGPLTRTLNLESSECAVTPRFLHKLFRELSLVHVQMFSNLSVLTKSCISPVSTVVQCPFQPLRCGGLLCITYKHH